MYLGAFDWLFGPVPAGFRNRPCGPRMSIAKQVQPKQTLLKNYQADPIVFRRAEQKKEGK